MSGTRYPRIAAALGIPAAVLMVLAALVKGKPPVGGASSADVASFFTGNHTALLVDGVVSIVAIPFLLVFLSGLRGRAAQSGDAGASAGSLLLASGAVLAAVLAVQSAVFEATVQHIAVRGDVPALRLASDVNWMLYAGLGIATAALLTAAAAVVATTDLLPRWTAWVAGILAVCAAVAGCATMYDDTSGVGVLGLIAWLGTAAWILVVSVLLLGRGEEQAHATRRVPARGV